jgi:hypothetical protein
MTSPSPSLTSPLYPLPSFLPPPPLSLSLSIPTANWSLRRSLVFSSLLAFFCLLWELVCLDSFNSCLWCGRNLRWGNVRLAKERRLECLWCVWERDWSWEQCWLILQLVVCVVHDWVSICASWKCTVVLKWCSSWEMVWSLCKWIWSLLFLHNNYVLVWERLGVVVFCNPSLLHIIIVYIAFTDFFPSRSMSTSRRKKRLEMLG